MSAPLLALLVAAGVALIAILAERRHAQRLRGMEHLAFGPSAAPRGWTNAVPPLRVLAMTGLAWGLTLLAASEPELLDPTGANEAASADPAELQRVLLVLDVSPSMNIEDAGADQKLRRRDRVMEVVEGVLSRIALSRTRFSVVVFFTSARPVVVDATDTAVVRNVLDNLPLVWSFEPGETRLLEGLRVAGELAKDWPPQSTTMFLCTDGDTVDFAQVPALPRSIRKVEILAVGDPLVGTFVGNHDSRQQAAVLRRLAAEVGGAYHNVNRQHMPSSALAELARVPPPPPDAPWQLRDIARLSIGASALVLALIPVGLQFFGSGWNAQRELRQRDASQSEDALPGVGQPASGRNGAQRGEPRSKDRALQAASPASSLSAGDDA